MVVEIHTSKQIKLIAPMKPISANLSLLGSLLLVSTSLHAGLIVYEPFGYPLGSSNSPASHYYNITTTGGVNGIPYSNTNEVDGVAGDPYCYTAAALGNPFGWTNSCEQPGTGLRNSWQNGHLVVNGLTYSQGSLSLATSDNAIFSTVANFAGDAFVYRDQGNDDMLVNPWVSGFDTAIGGSAPPLGTNGSVLYFSFVMQLSDTNVQARFGIGTLNNNIFIGQNDGPRSTNRWTIRHGLTGGGSGEVQATTNVTLFVGRLTCGPVTDTNSLMEVWVDPPLGAALGAAPLTLTGITNYAMNIQKFFTRCGSANVLTLDEIRVGTSLDDVTPTVGAPANPPTITATRSGNTLTLDWGVTGWVLQSQTTLLSQGLGTTGWVDVSPSTASLTSTNLTIDGGSEAVFYRLRQAP